MAFSYAIDFTGAKAQGAMGEKGGDNRIPDEGVYKVNIVELKDHETKNDDGSTRISQMFQLVIAEGEFAGKEMRVYLGTDFTKAGVRNQWFTALLSAGYTESEILSASAFKDSNFVGRTAFIQFIHAKDGGKNHTRNFITPSSYQTLLSKQTGGGATVTTASATVSVPAMNVAAPRPNGGGLRGMLGAK